jgi:hypothetical protein
MARLRELGWVESIHRYELRGGQRRWTSNLWRVVVPSELRGEVTAGEDRARAGEDRARARAQGGHSKQKAPAVPEPGPAASGDKQRGCERCDWTLWVPTPAGVVRCECFDAPP